MERYENRKLPEVPETIPMGDMPGDVVRVGNSDIGRAQTVFRKLIREISPIIRENPKKKLVISVCGGSGSGKTVMSSVLSFYLNQVGIGSYTLSGDNYPRRIPMYNDAERLHIFRENGLLGMIAAGEYTKERFQKLQEWQRKEDDANEHYQTEYPWFSYYLKAGRNGLESYLGTDKELEFEELEKIIMQFKEGASQIWLKRMGRTPEDLWYDKVDFSNKRILILEWTHGNSEFLSGVDYPIFLHSTPQETLNYRQKRNRDRAIDSPFTALILDIEQKKLESQVYKAKLILSRNGKIISYDEYKQLTQEA